MIAMKMLAQEARMPPMNGLGRAMLAGAITAVVLVAAFYVWRWIHGLLS